MLEEQGKIEFGDVSPLMKLESTIHEAIKERDDLVKQIKTYGQKVEKLETDLRGISKEKENLQNQLKKAETEKNNIYSSLLKLEEENKFISQSLEAEKTKNKQLENELNILKQDYINIANNLSELREMRQELKEFIRSYITEKPQLTSLSSLEQNSQDNSELSETNELISADKNQEKLVEIYNNNKLKDTYKELISVSMEPNSIETSRTGSGKKPILTEQSPSKYCIVSINGDLYLVPKKDALNTNDMTSVQVLFECEGYKKDVSNPKNFQLVKPGKVSEGNGHWVLEERGVLTHS
ncbi:hypothetical protein [Aphanothece sacrum]|uniref:Uncharacterized protein n=1 Tax=Aphanothece sacrum FPU1 TaxID=1920663 RepID=A0A401IC42_APHSA|nr:hypothetical protein [Aphanothece sacrum]GBF78796.1 hypothetical protein AsFPU1_0186 [Aphanothece sacrum FPU1]GBF83028.1 hypothetical protein AsFPU3_0066 [Aphanothece sacrum FPU3]